MTVSPHSGPSIGPSRRTLLKTGLIGGAGVVAGPMLWTQAARSAAPATGVHLSYGANPVRQMNVSWSTAGSVQGARLDLGVTPDYGLTVRPESLSSIRVDSVYHHVDLSDLKPGTRYYYRLSHDGGTPTRGSFTTAPKSRESFRFAAFGDMGVAEDAVRNVNLIRQQGAEFAFVVGDIAYADTGGQGKSGELQQDFGVWDEFLAQIQPSANAIPWMTVVGNHEMENGNGELGYDGYRARFRHPGNGAGSGQETYSFVRGNVAFIALDGNDATYEYTRNAGYLGAALDSWLEQRLAAFRARDDIDFILVGFHQCAYCTNIAHASDGGIRDRWEELFDRYQADVVINGHNHCYERTHLMRAGKPVQEAPRGATVDTEQGTIYITAGGGGGSTYPDVLPVLSYYTDKNGLKIPEPTTYRAVGDATHSVAFFDAHPRDAHGQAKLVLEVIASDGSEVDTLTITRSR
ncbi:metallophosphoesterase family protein [Nocardioides sp. KC13]|uniref:Metallophosphoesterase family protein n=1 Tax=Nocardioides turkmenicus TaxID=2711220 RepID=A0A6M1QY90_9ACTN|nr:metallophosphoesterase family protein [Nocardioides sp. KC13]